MSLPQEQGNLVNSIVNAVMVCGFISSLEQDFQDGYIDS
jgi:hypothetical protein